MTENLYPQNTTTFIDLPDMFDASEVSSMVKEDVVAYSQSLLRKQEMEDCINYASQESYNKGIEQGIEREIINSIKFMDKLGVPHETIGSHYGLSLQEIDNIVKS